jgi:hypothetical protein
VTVEGTKPGEMTVGGLVTGGSYIEWFSMCKVNKMPVTEGGSHSLFPLGEA